MQHGISICLYGDFTSFCYILEIYWYSVIVHGRVLFKMYTSDSIQTYYILRWNEKKFVIHLHYRNCILLSLSKLHYLSTAQF